MGMKTSNKIATFFKYFVLILVGVIMIYPLLWMISATFKDNSEIFAGISLWIKHPTLDGYRGALNNFGRFHQHPAGHAEHLQLRHPKVICTVVSACVAAYGFGRFDFPGRKLMFNIMLATLFLPQVVLNVPQYLPVQQVRLAGQPLLSGYLGALRICDRDLLRLPAGAVHAQVPRDLDEAAAIDGCSSFQTLYKVIVPMLGPALVSCALFQSCGAATTSWVRCFTSALPVSTRCPCSSSCPWTVIPVSHGTRSLLCPSSPSCRS